VPCLFFGLAEGSGFRVAPGEYGLSNLAATVAALLGYEPFEGWDESIIRHE
jgi:hypothetical protein